MRISDWSSDVCSSDLGIAVSALADKHDAQRNAGLRGSLVADTPPFTLVARHEQREPAAPDEIERRDAAFRAFEPGVRQSVAGLRHGMIFVAHRALRGRLGAIWHNRVAAVVEADFQIMRL